MGKSNKERKGKKNLRANVENTDTLKYILSQKER
jgi:hypothetical protein